MIAFTFAGHVGLSSTFAGHHLGLSFIFAGHLGLSSHFTSLQPRKNEI